MNQIRRVIVYSPGVPGLTNALSKALPRIQVVEITDLSEEATEHFHNEILVTNNDMIGPLLYRPHGQFAFIQGTWAGVESIFSHIKKDKERPTLQVARFTNRQFSQLMSEYTLGQVINSERGLLTIRDDQTLGTKSWRSDEFAHPRLIKELTIGILGVGNIGREIARTFQFFGARILGLTRRFPSQHRSPFVSHYYETSTLHEMLPQCDYICNVLPRTSQTTRLLTDELLKSCQARRPVFINIGRDNVVDDQTLLRALDEDWLRQAVLDVFAEEPLPSDHSFWSHPKIVITPHIAGPTRASDVADCLRANLELFDQGAPIENLVDWEAQY
ncbi:hypothetical protein TCAL_03331 [Tigriopus californicus]|uniref:D-isomer specific 2-hydroxyacid dehydrogenase NAD-binding domain-containing protein n=2 Tax=Tigriopus californicus TaxID=6832 RepID=A0A553P5W3_TIGCA|nr:glyoxylate/hydroxypyruvate reductase A-like isoform X2 [Tigriopus californicus]XP_059079676.1 glyoxylate/hydroxypyruvate reductase A-like isoform X2 [Tigriopus californicus]TRY73076.1 hypothetical protein TCAL_03331 [Tigriopus californicus]|eukprot:TCALIF_03331-PA protein Name:"Similar to ghrA Glyoxylate/hydroxypyruvate reductase A (Salmonella newport (strain SL254))" AED:0.02 eAED:0.02 QI:165/1/1/1/0.75/0.6/5/262/329